MAPLAQDSEEGGARGVHDRGAEAADEPDHQARFGQFMEVIHIFDHCKAGADRGAMNRRIDEKADMFFTDEQIDRQGLGPFLDDGGQIAAVEDYLHLQLVNEEQVQPHADHSGGRALEQAGDGRGAAHQLVAVEQQQDQGQEHHRRQAEDDLEGHHRIFSEAMNSRLRCRPSKATA